MHIRIGTRRSELARIQAALVSAELCALDADITIEYCLKASEGDRDKTTPLWQLPDRGIFTRDLSELLVEGGIDIAVHSWKDLPIEEDPATAVVATLPRADMRDVLLIAKDRWAKVSDSGTINILSSSPRRACNIEKFVCWALPAKINKVNFISVRGNVQTRIRKLLESEYDGLVVAKAALDRIIGRNEPEYREVCREVQEALGKCRWMITPLSVNPGAPGQGALAIEALRERRDLHEILSRINCGDSFAAVQEERKVLRRYGGGCHQKIGVAVFDRSYGRIAILRGETDSGEVLQQFDLKTSGVRPPRTSAEFVWPMQGPGDAILEGVPMAGVCSPSEENALWVAKASALPAQWKVSPDTVCWTAGVDTWRKLAERGVWVHGTADSLGESEPRRLENLTSADLKWLKLSHKDAPYTEDLPLYATYELIPTGRLPDLGKKTHFFWRSASAFKEALARYPHIKSSWNACGPGNTHDGIEKILGNAERLSVFLNHQQWLNEVAGA